MSNEIIQLYVDDQKTMKGYPITHAKLVINEKGGNIEDFEREIKNRQDFFEKNLTEAETVRNTSEATRVASENTRIQNEQSRTTEENKRQQQEGQREERYVIAETDRTQRYNQAEATRNSNASASETARSQSYSQAEATRDTRYNQAESSRNTSYWQEEAKRNQGEQNRISAETSRGNAESNRISAETSRVSAEISRNTNETSRVNAETSRATAETTRVNQENTRKSQETSRVNSENIRVSEFNNIKDEFGTFETIIDSKVGSDLYVDGDIDITNPEITVELSKINDKTNELETKGIQSQGRIIELEKNIADVNTQLADITQDTSITVTVGVGGQYANINQAIAFLSRKKLKYDNSGFTAEIVLKSGFIITEQIFVKNIDLGFITISSEDAEVEINATSFKTNVVEEPYGDSGYPLNSGAFVTGYGNAVIPIINILCDFKNTGVTGITHGLTLIYGATGRVARDKGFKNGKATGYYVLEGSRLYATDTVVINNYANNISCFRGSYILFRGGVATGSQTGYGAYLDNACTIDCISGNFSNNFKSGIWASASLVSANRSVINNNKENGILVDSACNCDCHQATLNDNGQCGIKSIGSLVTADNCTILRSGYQGLSCSNGGTISAKACDLTGSVLQCVSVSEGGVVNLRSAKAQKIEGTNGSDIRVVSGGLVFGHGTLGGYTGITPNKITSAGLVLNDEVIITETTFTGDTTFTPSGDWGGTLTYSKMTNGIVWLRGTLTAGTTLTPGTNIGAIIAGFRPPVTTPFSSIHANNNTQYGLHLSSAGGVYLSSTFVAGSYNINVLYHTV